VATIAVANTEAGFSADDLRTTEILCRAGSVLFDSYKRQQHELALEERLREAGKLKALGVLAGGIAHDFNNMLSTVMGNAELVAAALPENSESQNMLGAIITASQHAAELCNQMLAYACRGKLSFERVECSELVKELSALLEVSLPDTVTLECEVLEDLVFVEADKSQLRQVIMNLITNAADALGGDEGSVHVTIGAQHYDTDDLTRFRSMTPPVAGDYVRLTVTDDGCGMTAAMQAKIFDPFFTTKFTGRGLGLAAVQGIILSHNGGIGVDSEVGRGTTITILLPREAASQVAPRPQPEAEEEHVRKRVLVVDDEPTVRKILGLILETAGFDVARAADGFEAIEVLRRQTQAIDCVLLDLTMPHLGGEETFRELRRIRPDLPVVLSSGFTEQEVLDRFEGESFAGFVQKPALAKTVIAKIQAAIDMG
jgi:signal transduction histidine kinase/CheY-like chemotaxis protein